MTYSMPKWYVIREKIANTIGLDSEVEVSPLIEGEKIGIYDINIITDDKKKGSALNTIMKSKHFINNVLVDIKVMNKAGKLYNSCDIFSKESILNIIEDAFKGNPLYVKTALCKDAVRNAVYPIFKPTIIQFFNDNMNDYYNNFNGYPAQILKEILNVNIIGVQILISTDKIK